MFVVKHRFWLSLLCVINSVQFVGAHVLFRGNVSGEERSFSFPLSSCVGGFKSEAFCTTAAQAGAQEYALAWSDGSPLFKPLALKKVQLNYSQDANGQPDYDQDNPLYDKAISHVALFASQPFRGYSYYPIVTLKDDPARLHIVSTFVYLGTPNEKVAVISSDLINDAGILTEDPEKQEDGTVKNVIRQVRTPMPTDEVVGLCVASFEATATIFAAVKPHSKNGESLFGQVGSGIAMLSYGAEWQQKDDTKDEDLTEEERKKKAEVKYLAQRRWLLTCDAISGDKGNRAFALDGRSVCLNINNGVHAFHNKTVDMWWDGQLGCLYVALQLSTKPNATDDQGAVAVLMGRVVQLAEKVKDEDGNEKVVKVYSQLKFYPVIEADSLHGADNKIVGALGPNKHVSIHKVRTMRTTIGFRYLVVVGGNGTVETTKDVVHALPLVSNPSDDHLGMIAYKDSSSQVEYSKNAKGGPGKHQKFMSRSLCSRAPGEETRGSAITKEVFTSYDKSTQVGAGRAPGDVIDILAYGDAVFVAVEGAHAGVYHSRSMFDANGMIASWTPWERYLQGSIHAFGIDGSGRIWTFKSDEDGEPTVIQKTKWTGKTDLAQCLAQEFPQELGGVQGFFDFSCSADTPLLVATGYKKVALIDDEREVRTLAGGALDEVKAVTCAQVITSGPTGWLMVGGSNGLAVLCDERGYAWDSFVGIKNSFSVDATFRNLGDYSFVRKIVQDGDNVYVLTNDRLDRIDLMQTDFSKGELEVVTLARSAELTGTFVDCAVSGKFALLATSCGLFRVGNGCDIATADNMNDVGWSVTKVPDAQACCLKLDCISPTGREADFACNGQVHVLSVYTHTVFTRFSVNLCDEVTDQTLQPLPDQKLKAFERAHFLSLGGVMNDMPSDGAIYFQTRSRHRSQAPYVKPFINGTLSKRTPPLALGIEDACHIHGMLHSPLMASWVAYGDFGLREIQ